MPLRLDISEEPDAAIQQRTATTDYEQGSSVGWMQQPTKWSSVGGD
jgi:uncharacterized protein with LGFP repeats